ncbi:tetratricopeptide repeat protein [Chitinophaga costaii]|uniref:tetratricopeptide repeat protein n=1 Tax=Chitinophaga costaii TaxID=1335309 RepID=UPI000F4EF9B8|nr:tetratricopeptide repeat protein [Chitinophaga costaii]
MRKSQVLLTGVGIVAVVLLFAFGRTVPKPDKRTATTAAAAPMMGGGQPGVAIDFKDLLAQAKQNVPASSLIKITSLENKVVRGDVKAQQANVFHELASAWDSLHQPPLAAYYLGEAAKLENSEKSLTFAANLFLTDLQQVDNQDLAKWEAQQAIALYDKSIELNPDNDSLRISQALAYMQSGEPMVGVGKLRAVVEKNPENLDAQVTLANLAITSGQYDKAIDRLEGVLKNHPDNVKALFVLAEAYKGMGNKEKAVQLFERCKQNVKDPALIKEIDDYIADTK